MGQRRGSWFARLSRTAEIENHVFMIRYRPGERPGAAADRSDPSIGGQFHRATSLARRYAQGRNHPQQPRTARARADAGQVCGRAPCRPARGSRDLRQHFKPGWIAPA